MDHKDGRGILTVYLATLRGDGAGHGIEDLTLPEFSQIGAALLLGKGFTGECKVMVSAFEESLSHQGGRCLGKA